MTRLLLFSNNPEYHSLVRPGLEFRLVPGSALAVFVAGRDAVHLGWRLLNHPLYGNFLPGHQPCRTLLLAAPQSEGAGTDLESLEMVEQAQARYAAVKNLPAPQDVGEALRCDCALLDKALMEETFRKYL